MEMYVKLTAIEVAKIDVTLEALIKREKLIAGLFKADYSKESEAMVTELEYIRMKLAENPINDKANCNPKINREYCGLKGSKDVLDFIYKFLAHHNSGIAEDILKNQFNAGYCYHFASILKTTFDRGEICWCAPYGHICWVDIDGVPYDIYGICTSEADYFIPIRYLDKAIYDFLHVDGKTYCATKEQIQKIINKYLEDHKYKYKVEFVGDIRTLWFHKVEHALNYTERIFYTDCKYSLKPIMSAALSLSKTGDKWQSVDGEIIIEVEDMN